MEGYGNGRDLSTEDKYNLRQLVNAMTTRQRSVVRDLLNDEEKERQVKEAYEKAQLSGPLVADKRYEYSGEPGSGPISYGAKGADTKATNPKDAIGGSKLPIHLWPGVATVLGALGLLDGSLKYGRQNWRAAGVKYSIYLDAAMRHLMAAWEGEDNDPDSGLPHEAHVLACMAIIVDARTNGKLTDDRAFSERRSYFYRKFIDAMTIHVERLKQKYQNRPLPRHYTLQDNPENQCKQTCNTSADAPYVNQPQQGPIRGGKL